jgi:uncharacterized membrane protein YedE/YeeE
MLSNGRLAGISGILGELLARWPARWPQSLAFIAGLPAGLLLWQMLSGQTYEITLPHNALLLIPAGLLVGFGARLGNGCTSGHGVCGLARLSPRSMLATGIFMAVAVIVVTLRQVLS